MDKNLQTLLELARKHTITPEEHQAQVRSFTFGNTNLENSTITREEVDAAVSSLNREPRPKDDTK